MCHQRGVSIRTRAARETFEHERHCHCHVSDPNCHKSRVRLEMRHRSSTRANISELTLFPECRFYTHSSILEFNVLSINGAAEPSKENYYYTGTTAVIMDNIIR